MSILRAAADRGRDAIEHAVDERGGFRGAESLRELDGFVDHDAVRNLEPVLELPGADDEDRALDGRQARRVAVEPRRDALDQRSFVGGNAGPERVEVRLIGESESSGFSTFWSLNSLMCSRPSSPGSSSTKTPKLAIFVTWPLTTMPGR